MEFIFTVRHVSKIHQYHQVRFFLIPNYELKINLTIFQSFIQKGKEHHQCQMKYFIFILYFKLIKIFNVYLLLPL